MFSPFFKYFFMLNGLPIYCRGQNKHIYALWYVWRVSIVLRYNIELIMCIYRAVARWIFPYSVFGIIDMLVTTSILDSLIGKHEKLINLQKKFSKSFRKKSYLISTADQCKMKAMQAFFGLTFAFSVFNLVYSLKNVNTAELDEDEKSFIASRYSWFLILFVSMTSWVTTVSNVLFYCVFCKHLKSMFQSINKKAHGLAFDEIKNKSRGFDHCGPKSIEYNEPAAFPASVSLVPEMHARNAAALSLPQLSFRSRKDSNAESESFTNGRRFSCSVFGFRKEAKQSSELPEANESQKRDADRDNDLAHRIQNLSKKFANTSLLVKETDDLFSLQVLMILSITFLRACTLIFLYISSDWPQTDSCASLTIVQQIFFDFLSFGSVAIEASLVCEEARKFSSIVMNANELFHSKSIRVQVQGDVALLTGHSFDVQLTAWKFFTVSRSFVPTVIGVTATYILIILQVYQIVQEGRCSSFQNTTDVYSNTSAEYVRDYV